MKNYFSMITLLLSGLVALDSVAQNMSSPVSTTNQAIQYDPLQNTVSIGLTAFYDVYRKGVYFRDNRKAARLAIFSNGYIVYSASGRSALSGENKLESRQLRQLLTTLEDAISDKCATSIEVNRLTGIITKVKIEACPDTV
jgi:hypothetical protein